MLTEVAKRLLQETQAYKKDAVRIQALNDLSPPTTR